MQETRRASPDAVIAVDGEDAAASAYAEVTRARCRALAADYMANLGVVRHDGGRASTLPVSSEVAETLDVFVDPKAVAARNAANLMLLDAL